MSDDARAIDSLLEENRVFQPDAAFAAKARIEAEELLAEAEKAKQTEPAATAEAKAAPAEAPATTEASAERQSTSKGGGSGGGSGGPH